MGWNYKSSRSGRAHRRPDLEALEVRQLLSLTDPVPTASSSSFVRANGTVDYDAVIQGSEARATYQVDGAGSNVAVIDTGVNYANPAFGSGGVGQPGNKVVAGVDFTGSPQGVLPTWQHGTGVAGLIASTDADNPGVAPGAGIVALRVFGDNNAGSFDNIAKALDWVVQNHDQYQITAVNLSVSDGGNYQSNQFGADGSAGQSITEAVETLIAENIPVVVATGNKFDGKTQGQGFASIIPETISVTATDETKATAKGTIPLASDAQRLGVGKGGASATDLAAPGVDLIGPSGGSNTATNEGTSFATPQVTGTVVLLQQMYRRAFGTLPTVAQLEGWLDAGSDKFRDAATGIEIGRLNVAGALQVLQSQIQAVAAPSVATPPPVSVPPVVAAPQVLAPTPEPTPVVTPIPIVPVASSPVTTSTPPASTVPESLNATPAAPPAPPIAEPANPAAEPMTEVIVNGASIGQVATSQLSGTYSRLFALTHGVARNLRAWVPNGSTLTVAASKPSGTEVRTRAVAIPTRAQPRTGVIATRNGPTVAAAVVRPMARPGRLARLAAQTPAKTPAVT